MNELTLPEWAFLYAHVSDQEDPLEGRNVLLHVRSASVVEIFDRALVFLKDDVITHRFSFTGKSGIREKMVAVLHYSTTITDPEDIKELVLKPAAKWYCDYVAWEDQDVLGGGYNDE